MLPFFFKAFQNNVSKTNEILTNEQGVEALSDTPLSNTLALEIIFSKLSTSSNSFLQILYNIIKDNPYAIFLFIVISVFILTMIIRVILHLFTVRSTKKNIFKRFIKIFLSPRFIWIGFLLGIIVGVDILGIYKPIAHFIKGCLLSVLLWIFYNITDRLFLVYTKAILIYKSKGTRIKYFRNKNIFIVFSRIVHALWFLVFLTVLLGLWGVELGPILAGLGIVGIVVGLALQDSFSHVIGGLSLMLDETYSEGDIVSLDNQYEGIIFQIGYRSTKLRTYDEEIIIIPNGVLAKMVIINTSLPVRRSRINLFYKTYSSEATPEEVKELLLQAARSSSATLRHPEPYVFFLEPEGSLYSFRLSCYCNSPSEKMSTKDSVQQEVVRLFTERGIRFGIPENTTYLHK